MTKLKGPNKDNGTKNFAVRAPENQLNFNARICGKRPGIRYLQVLRTRDSSSGIVPAVCFQRLTLAGGRVAQPSAFSLLVPEQSLPRPAQSARKDGAPPRSCDLTANPETEKVGHPALRLPKARVAIALATWLPASRRTGRSSRSHGGSSGYGTSRWERAGCHRAGRSPSLR
jgi:hypothetical protein